MSRSGAASCARGARSTRSSRRTGSARASPGGGSRPRPPRRARTRSSSAARRGGLRLHRRALGRLGGGVRAGPAELEGERQRRRRELVALLLREPPAEGADLRAAAQPLAGGCPPASPRWRAGGRPRARGSRLSADALVAPIDGVGFAVIAGAGGAGRRAEGSRGRSTAALGPPGALGARRVLAAREAGLRARRRARVGDGPARRRRAPRRAASVRGPAAAGRLAERRLAPLDGLTRQARARMRRRPSHTFSIAATPPRWRARWAFTRRPRATGSPACASCFGDALETPTRGSSSSSRSGLAGGVSSSGSSRLTTAPPSGAFSARAVPPCSSATRCTIARPRPEPGLAARLVGAPEAVEDLVEVAGGKPGAVVADGDPAAVDRDLDRAAGRAPLAGVVEHVRDRPAEPLGVGVDQAGLELALEAEAAGAALGALDRVAGELVEGDVLARDRVLARARAPARRRRRPGRSSPPAPAVTSSTSRLRSSGSIWSLRPSVSMLVRSVASGVRSSCEASATSRRCAASERSSAAIISLKLAASRPSSSSPRDLDPLGQVVGPRDLLGRVGDLAGRRERGARHERPERRGERDAAGADRGQDDDQGVEGVVGVLERAGHLHRAARRPAAGSAPAGRCRRRVTSLEIARRRRWRASCGPRSRPGSGPATRRRCTTAPLGPISCARAGGPPGPGGGTASADLLAAAAALRRAGLPRAAARRRPAGRRRIASRRLRLPDDPLAAARRSRLMAQVVVDVAAQPVADQRVDEDRGEQHRERDREAESRASRRRRLTSRAASSRPRAPSGSAAARRPPRSCGAGSRCRPRASSSSARSRSPRRASKSCVRVSTRRGWRSRCSSRANSVLVSSIGAVAAVDLAGGGIERQVGVARARRSASPFVRRSSARSRASSSSSANGLTR